MSFTFKWPHFSEQFHADAKRLLDAALNKGDKPPVIAGRIEVIDLHMGSQPPELEVRDIGELTTEHFRGIFRLTYAGDAHVVLRTKVQANPLNHKQNEIHNLVGSIGILAAHQPLVVPMLLRLSHFKLSSLVILVMSKQKGITLVFKTDPLQNVDVNSTFDSIAAIQKYIQKEIEGQLRNMFQEDLPGIIHRLSQRWLAAQTQKSVYVGPSYPVNFTRQSQQLPFQSQTNDSVLSLTSDQYIVDPLDAYNLTSAVNSISPRTPLQDTSFPDIEHYDPTYGLRPESFPSNAEYLKFADLFTTDAGLRDLQTVSRETGKQVERLVGDRSNESENRFSRPSSRLSTQRTISIMANEASVAGEETNKRPRIYHAQSYSADSTLTDADAPSCDGGSNHPRRQNVLSRRDDYLSSISMRHPLGQSADRYLRHDLGNILDDENTRVIHPSYLDGAPSSISTSSNNSSLHTPPRTSGSVAEGGRAVMESNSALLLEPELKESSNTIAGGCITDGIILRPALNNRVSYLSVLNHSYRTLSPYTRSVEHFTVRTRQPQTATNALPERIQVKARRRRTYRVYHSPSLNSDDPQMNFPIRTTASPPPPSDCELSDVEHYFRSPSLSSASCE